MLRLLILVLVLGFTVAYIPSIALYFKKRPLIKRFKKIKKITQLEEINEALYEEKEGNS